MSYYTQEQLLSKYILSQKDQLKFEHIIQSINRCEKNYEIYFSDFLKPNIVKMLFEYSIDDSFIIKKWGGCKEAERKLICFLPFYEEIKNESFPIKVIKINYHEKFSNISHSDILGALINLGIKRDKIGDIYVYPGYSHVVVYDKMDIFIRLNLKKIKRSSVSIDLIDNKKLDYKSPKYKKFNLTINSNRIDAIISKAFSISRKESKKLISNKKVKMDHFIINDSKVEVSEGALLSVRGHGRVLLDEFLGKTRKNRLKILFKKII